MCVACRESQDKRSLVRIVRTPRGVYVDETGKLSGRGAYLHADASCWEKGIKKSLENSLKANFTSEDRERLGDYLTSLKNQTDQADD
jgi:predicted RNA-binding protein YlxR (DUF448 family)